MAKATADSRRRPSDWRGEGRTKWKGTPKYLLCNVHNSEIDTAEVDASGRDNAPENLNGSY
ncbi:hypothetical protein CA13_66930 [Planctomycetes bacterium CA13]|uniref:Uncharacterized protein n=1 Tax=Novipirellula herctigrandis TaxID=2527986 RepID=A0A5C5YMP9_9BACT|nr:hypothetical protein CA13_66930 [Planctomycetes bacterium CA13]